MPGHSLPRKRRGIFFIISCRKSLYLSVLISLEMIRLRKEYFILVLVVSLLTSSSGFAQKFLAIDKSGKIKRLRFYVNDKINIRLNDESFFRGGNIDAIEDTSFIFDGKNIPLSRVDAILVYKNKGGHALLRGASGTFPAAGVFLLFIATVNSLVNHTYPIIPGNVVLISGGLIATGLLLHPLTFRIYQAKKHPLKIIDVTVVAVEK